MSKAAWWSGAVDDRLERQTAWLQQRQAEHVQSRERMLSTIQEAASELERCAEAAGANQVIQVMLDQAMDRLNRVARDLRCEISPLSHAVLDGKDLMQSLEQLVTEVTDASLARVETRLDESIQGQLPSHRAVHLLHVVREAFANAIRHSGARLMAIRAAAENRRLVISISDDGHGFDLKAAQQDYRQGLARMQSRAESAGALLQVESAPGAGTIVTVAVPLQKDWPDLRFVDGPLA